MPPVPSLSGMKVVRALQKMGYTLTRVRGSHHVLHHPSGRTVAVPVHRNRDLAKGTLRSILDVTEISVDQLKELL